MRKRADQTRRCQPHHEKETGTDHGSMPGGQHLQTHPGRDGTTFQSDGALAGSSELLLGEPGGRAGWKQSAHAAKLQGVRQAQTDTKSESQRAKRSSDARVLRVWVESAGPD